MMDMDLLHSPVALSIKCGLLSVCLCLPWGTFWGWLLARRRFPGRMLLQTALYLPLVIPPVLTGYALLTLLSIRSPVGRWLEQALGLRFVLDWKGAALAAAVVASPFMIQSVKSAFEALDERLEWVAANLGAGKARVFLTVTLPLMWPGLVSGMLLVLSRSLGEFGATIIVAGNIPGFTQTIPLALYSHVSLGQEQAMLPLVIVAVSLAYLGLAFSQKLLSQPERRKV